MRVVTEGDGRERRVGEGRCSTRNAQLYSTEVEKINN